MNGTINQGFSMATNMTNDSKETFPGGSGSPVPHHIQIGVTILAVIVIILAMIGNTLVIYIVCTVNHMRSSTNTLIANMAVADLLMTIDIPYILKWVYVWDHWFGTFMGTVLCKCFHSAQVGSLAASVFSLVAISLDRSFAILFPMKTIMTRNVVRFTIVMTWLGALALTVPLMVATKNMEGMNYFSCDENWPSSSLSRTTYVTFLFTTSYIIPLSIIAIVYCLAGLRLWRRKLPGRCNSIAHGKAQASSRRASLMLITVVVIFALSWFPFQALEMIRVFNPQLLYEHTIPMEVYFVIPWFGYCNSAINPILYVIFSEKYRQEFYRILCRGPSRKERYRNSIIRSLGATQMTRLSQGTSIAADIPLRMLRRETNQEEQETLKSLHLSPVRCYVKDGFLIAS
ncbi:RYamide receptor-like [Oculina patagonica]